MISVGTSAGAVSTGLRLGVKVGHLHAWMQWAWVRGLA